MTLADRIPADVTVVICIDCRGQTPDPAACKAAKHRLSHVHYEISEQQNDALARERVADLQRHGRRLLQDAPE